MRTRLQLRTLLLAFTCLLGLAALPVGLRAQQVNMSRYITLTVKQGAEITLNFAAEADNTPVRVVSGSTDKTISVGTEFIGEQKYAAGATTMTVYGNVNKLDCSSNGENLTALDVSHNQGLVSLSCYHNYLTSLDVSNNPKLERFNCSDNGLTSLDVSKNSKLESFNCSHNGLTSLDVSKNSKLKDFNCGGNRLTSLDVSNNHYLWMLACYINKLASLKVSKNPYLRLLFCGYNHLTSLDVSKNPELKVFSCYHNYLTSLDVSKNLKLEELDCRGNQFTTQEWDKIFCALPDRTNAAEAAKIIALDDDYSDSNKDLVLAANGSNAKKKNWQTLNDNNGDPSPITGFTGKYVCGGGSTGIPQEQLEPLAVRPNPTHDGLYLVAEGIVRVYSVEGHLVLSAMAKGETYLDLSDLPDGVYIVRTGDRVASVVKK